MKNKKNNFPEKEAFRADVPDDGWLMKESTDCGWTFLKARDCGRWVEYDFLNKNGKPKSIALAKRMAA